MSLTLYEEDVSIYQKDLDTLKPRQWLNDQIISFSMARIEKTLSDIDASVRFLDASLVSCLRLQLDDEDKEDVKSFVEGIGLTTSSAVVVPLTNRTSLESSSTHWSLLYIDLKDNLVLHFDSHSNFNRQAAEMATKDIYQLLDKDVVPEVINAKCPQQENGYDCGIFTILHAQYLAEDMQSIMNASINSKLEVIEDGVNRFMTQHRIEGYREETIKRIQDLRQL